MQLGGFVFGTNKNNNHKILQQNVRLYYRPLKCVPQKCPVLCIVYFMYMYKNIIVGFRNCLLVLKDFTPAQLYFRWQKTFLIQMVANTRSFWKTSLLFVHVTEFSAYPKSPVNATIKKDSREFWKWKKAVSLSFWMRHILQARVKRNRINICFSLAFFSLFHFPIPTQRTSASPVNSLRMRNTPS